MRTSAGKPICWTIWKAAPAAAWTLPKYAGASAAPWGAGCTAWGAICWATSQPTACCWHQFFHEQAAQLVEWAQLGEWNKAVQVLNGGYRYGSSQVVLLLKELKRGLPAA